MGSPGLIALFSICIVVAISIYIVWAAFKVKRECPKAIAKAEQDRDDCEEALQKYISRARLEPHEIGTRYERYIGHLYEMSGYDVEYHGAVKGFADLGRDLIIRKGKEVFIVQTKCWSNKKIIHDKYILHLYGSIEHYKKTRNARGASVKAIFYTSSARYSELAIDVANDLGVELKIKKLDNSFPRVKCKISSYGEKTYHLPFDEDYDKLRVDPSKGEFFAHTVLEAFDHGHRRPEDKESAA